MSPISTESNQAEYHEFCDECPDCRPAIVNTLTGQPYPDDTPLMIAVYRMWRGISYAHRKAFMAVSRHNSQQPDDVRLAQTVMQKINEISQAIPE